MANENPDSSRWCRLILCRHGQSENARRFVHNLTASEECRLPMVSAGEDDLTDTGREDTLYLAEMIRNTLQRQPNTYGKVKLVFSDSLRAKRTAAILHANLEELCVEVSASPPNKALRELGSAEYHPLKEGNKVAHLAQWLAYVHDQLEPTTALVVVSHSVIMAHALRRITGCQTAAFALGVSSMSVLDWDTTSGDVVVHSINETRHDTPKLTWRREDAVEKLT